MLTYTVGKDKTARCLVIAAILSLASCAENPPAPVEDRSLRHQQAVRSTDKKQIQSEERSNSSMYRVAKGDTLHGIAFNYGVDYRDLAEWNHIAPPYRIYVGQELQLSAAKARTSALAEPPPPATVAALPAEGARASTSRLTKPQPPPSEGPGPLLPAEPVQSKGNVAKNEPLPAQKTLAPAVEAEVVEAPVISPASSALPATSNNNGIVWQWPSSGAVVSGFVGGDQTRQGIDLAGHAGDPVKAAADGSVVYSGNGLLGYGELIIIKHNSNFLSAYGHNRKRLVQEGAPVKAGQVIAEMGASGSSREMLHFEIRKNGKPVNPLEFLPTK